MQDIVVGAFRKRLSKRGYSNISIKRDKLVSGFKSNFYNVTAIEPLSNTLVCTKLSVIDMYSMFR